MSEQPHGTAASYRRWCRCALCKAAKSAERRLAYQKERAGQVSRPMGRPRTFTDVVCQSGPHRLTADEVRKGLKRCRECRAKAPALPRVYPKATRHHPYTEAYMKRPDLKAPRSWWIDAPRNITALAEAEVPRMRRGVSVYVDMERMEPRSVAKKSMRSQPL